jgi:hypothetical protein
LSDLLFFAALENGGRLDYAIKAAGFRSAADRIKARVALAMR